MVFMTRYSSPLGEITLAGENNKLIGLWISQQKYFAATLPDPVEEKFDLPIFTQTKEWLDAYFNGKNPAITDLALAPKGSDFRQAVWRILREIPYGQCMTYGQIAKEMALLLKKKTMSSQAVGGAVGHNPISIIIPCHRVVGANGSLTGFASGLEKKIQLLQLEGVDMRPYFIPKKGTAL